MEDKNSTVASTPAFAAPLPWRLGVTIAPQAAALLLGLLLRFEIALAIA